MTPTITVSIKGHNRPIGKTQLARHLEKAIRSFDPQGVALPKIIIRDADNVSRIYPNQLRQNPHADLLDKIEAEASAIRLSATAKKQIEEARREKRPERNDWAEDLALRFGFTVIDDKRDIFGVTLDRLTDLMSVLSYHATGGQTSVRHIDTKTSPAETKTEHDDIDKLLYAYGQAATCLKVGDNFYELPEFKAVKDAFAKKTVAATIKIDTEHFVKDVGDFVAALERTKLRTNPLGALVGSDESDFAVKVRKGYAGLHRILVEALDQAQSGKGAERHNLGGDIPFEEQRMQTISELIGSVHGMAYQACKKITEGVSLPTLDRQVRELLGAINYIAGIIVYLRKQDDGESDKTKFANYCAADVDPLQVSEFSRDMVRQMREAANPMPDVPYESARQALAETQTAEIPTVGKAATPASDQGLAALKDFALIAKDVIGIKSLKTLLAAEGAKRIHDLPVEKRERFMLFCLEEVVKTLG